MNGPVYRQLLDARRDGPGFFWLVDPDKITASTPDPRWEKAGALGVTAFLVGTSQPGNHDYDAAVAALREHARIPLILFPGSAAQVSPLVDAVLFLSLLSGRNPDYLVGEQVKGAPRIRDYDIEPIPTGYLLIDTGSETSVARASRTAPIPETEIEAIADHALCAQYMGHAFVYLEAGSGAARAIGGAVIATVKQHVSIPVIVGGGIKTPEACAAAITAGADFVVVGTALERDRSEHLLAAMAETVRRSGATVNV